MLAKWKNEIISQFMNVTEVCLLLFSNQNNKDDPQRISENT